MAKFKGKKGDDTLIGTNHDDLLFGLGGNDQLYGRRGDDLIVGGRGNDVLRGGKGKDTLFGGRGNDLIDGGLADDWLASGAGADTFVHRAGDGFDTVVAGTYDSQDLVVIAGEDYYDFNYAWTGKDLHVAAAVDGNYAFADTGSLTFKDFFTGGKGFITVQIDTQFNDFYGFDFELATIRIERGLTGIYNINDGEIIIGTEGDDVINGNGGYYDAVFGNGGNDVINGGENSAVGADHFRGGEGDDVLNGFADDDRLRGDAGNDTIDGGDGKDRADYDHAESGVIVDLSIGQAIDDGEGGHDTLINIEDIRGGAYADFISGDAGENVLRGQGGDDFLVAGLNDDILFGGADSDTFAFNSFGEGMDVIFDFDGASEKLAFKGSLDVGGDGILDDLQAAISDVFDAGKDIGAGYDVQVFFNSGYVLTFKGVGTGDITDITQLVADPSTQIITF